jgi:hypothetical protein
MGPVLFLRQTGHFQSMEFDRVEDYAVSDQAHGRGYGPPKEIVRAESGADGNA